jgi:hypothetical protein
MHCRHCGCVMTPYELAELASQADRCACAAPVEAGAMIWWCDRCYPMVVEGATHAHKRGKEDRGGIGQDKGKAAKRDGGLLPLLQ